MKVHGRRLFLGNSVLDVHDFMSVVLRSCYHCCEFDCPGVGGGKCSSPQPRCGLCKNAHRTPECPNNRRNLPDTVTPRQAAGVSTTVNMHCARCSARAARVRKTESDPTKRRQLLRQFDPTTHGAVQIHRCPVAREPINHFTPRYNVEIQ